MELTHVYRPPGSTKKNSRRKKMSKDLSLGLHTQGAQTSWQEDSCPFVKYIPARMKIGSVSGP